MDEKKNPVVMEFPKQEKIEDSNHAECTEELEMQSADEEGDKKYPFMCLFEVASMKRVIKPNKKIVFDVSDTMYKVIKSTATNLMGWTTVNGNCAREDWNIMWYDSYISEEVLRRMLPYQKVNHFPGSFHLGKKNYLAQNLSRMRKTMNDDYSFFPRTWNIPLQLEDFKRHNQNIQTKKPYYIVKPESSCQGRGIYLTKKVEGLTYHDHCVIQEYVKNPFLIDGLKFDFRIYVLLKSVQPLKIFMYPEGLARFATVKYSKPNKKNCSNFMMHLTNYAVNKKSPDFVFNSDDHNDGIGHKRSFSSVLKQLYDMGHNITNLYMEIRQLIVKTIISVQPQLAHIYRSSQPRDHSSEMCFEVLGFDVMIDDKIKPWLLEVNHSASFHCDSPLDLAIKKNVILDTFNLIHVSSKEKKQYFDSKVQPQFAYRKKEILTPIIDQQQSEQKVLKFEASHKGAYLQIYPSEDDPMNYQKLINVAEMEWKESTAPKKAIISIQSPIKLKISPIKKIGINYTKQQDKIQLINESKLPNSCTGGIVLKNRFYREYNASQSSACRFLPSLSKIGSHENIVQRDSNFNEIDGESQQEENLFETGEQLEEERREQIKQLSESQLNQKMAMSQGQERSYISIDKEINLCQEKEEAKFSFISTHSMQLIAQLNQPLLSDQPFSRSFSLIQQEQNHNQSIQQDLQNPSSLSDQQTQSTGTKWQIFSQENEPISINECKINTNSKSQISNTSSVLSPPADNVMDTPYTCEITKGSQKQKQKAIIMNNVSSLYENLIGEEANILKMSSISQNSVKGNSPVVIRENRNSIIRGDTQNLKKLNVVNLGMNLQAELIHDSWSMQTQKPLYLKSSARKSQKSQLRPLPCEFQRLMMRETRGSQIGAFAKDSTPAQKNIVVRQNQQYQPPTYCSEEKQQALKDAVELLKLPKKQNSAPSNKNNNNTNPNVIQNSININNSSTLSEQNKNESNQRCNLSNLITNSNISTKLNTSALASIQKEQMSISPKKRFAGKSADRKQIKNIIMNETVIDNSRQELMQRGILLAGIKSNSRTTNESIEFENEKKQPIETNNHNIIPPTPNLIESTFQTQPPQNIFLRPKCSSLSSHTNIKPQQQGKATQNLLQQQTEIISTPHQVSHTLQKAKVSSHQQK